MSDKAKKPPEKKSGGAAKKETNPPKKVSTAKKAKESPKKKKTASPRGGRSSAKLSESAESATSVVTTASSKSSRAKYDGSHKKSEEADVTDFMATPPVLNIPNQVDYSYARTFSRLKPYRDRDKKAERAAVKAIMTQKNHRVPEWIEEGIENEYFDEWYAKIAYPNDERPNIDWMTLDWETYDEKTDVIYADSHFEALKIARLKGIPRYCEMDTEALIFPDLEKEPTAVMRKDPERPGEIRYSKHFKYECEKYLREDWNHKIQEIGPTGMPLSKEGNAMPLLEDKQYTMPMSELDPKQGIVDAWMRPEREVQLQDGVYYEKIDIKAGDWGTQTENPRVNVDEKGEPVWTQRYPPAMLQVISNPTLYKIATMIQDGSWPETMPITEPIHYIAGRKIVNTAVGFLRPLGSQDLSPNGTEVNLLGFMPTPLAKDYMQEKALGFLSKKNYRMLAATVKRLTKYPKSIYAIPERVGFAHPSDLEGMCNAIKDVVLPITPLNMLMRVVAWNTNAAIWGQIICAHYNHLKSKPKMAKELDNFAGPLFGPIEDFWNAIYQLTGELALNWLKYLIDIAMSLSGYAEDTREFWKVPESKDAFTFAAIMLADTNMLNLNINLLGIDKEDPEFRRSEAGIVSFALNADHWGKISEAISTTMVMAGCVSECVIKNGPTGTTNRQITRALADEMLQDAKCEVRNTLIMAKNWSLKNAWRLEKDIPTPSDEPEIKEKGIYQVESWKRRRELAPTILDGIKDVGPTWPEFWRKFNMPHRTLQQRIAIREEEKLFVPEEDLQWPTAQHNKKLIRGSEYDPKAENFMFHDKTTFPTHEDRVAYVEERTKPQTVAQHWDWKRIEKFSVTNCPKMDKLVTEKDSEEHQKAKREALKAYKKRNNLVNPEEEKVFTVSTPMEIGQDALTTINQGENKAAPMDVDSQDTSVKEKIGKWENKMPSAINKDVDQTTDKDLEERRKKIREKMREQAAKNPVTEMTKEEREAMYARVKRHRESERAKEEARAKRAAEKAAETRATDQEIDELLNEQPIEQFAKTAPVQDVHMQDAPETSGLASQQSAKDPLLENEKEIMDYEEDDNLIEEQMSKERQVAEEAIDQAPTTVHSALGEIMTAEHYAESKGNKKFFCHSIGPDATYDEIPIPQCQMVGIGNHALGKMPMCTTVQMPTLMLQGLPELDAEYRRSKTIETQRGKPDQISDLLNTNCFTNAVNSLKTQDVFDIFEKEENPDKILLNSTAGGGLFNMTEKHPMLEPMKKVEKAAIHAMEQQDVLLRRVPFMDTRGKKKEQIKAEREEVDIKREYQRSYFTGFYNKLHPYVGTTLIRRLQGGLTRPPRYELCGEDHQGYAVFLKAEDLQAISELLACYENIKQKTLRSGMQQYTGPWYRTHVNKHAENISNAVELAARIVTALEQAMKTFDELDWKFYDDGDIYKIYSQNFTTDESLLQRVHGNGKKSYAKMPIGAVMRRVPYGFPMPDELVDPDDMCTYTRLQMMFAIELNGYSAEEKQYVSLLYTAIPVADQHNMPRWLLRGDFLEKFIKCDRTIIPFGSKVIQFYAEEFYQRCSNDVEDHKVKDIPKPGKDAPKEAHYISHMTWSQLHRALNWHPREYRPMRICDLKECPCCRWKRIIPGTGLRHSDFCIYNIFVRDWGAAGLFVMRRPQDVGFQNDKMPNPTKESMEEIGNKVAKKLMTEYETWINVLMEEGYDLEQAKLYVYKNQPKLLPEDVLSEVRKSMGMIPCHSGTKRKAKDDLSTASSRDTSPAKDFSKSMYNSTDSKTWQRGRKDSLKSQDDEYKRYSTAVKRQKRSTSRTPATASRSGPTNSSSRESQQDRRPRVLNTKEGMIATYMCAAVVNRKWTPSVETATRLNVPPSVTHVRPNTKGTLEEFYRAQTNNRRLTPREFWKKCFEATRKKAIAGGWDLENLKDTRIPESLLPDLIHSGVIAAQDEVATYPDIFGVMSINKERYNNEPIFRQEINSALLNFFGPQLYEEMFRENARPSAQIERDVPRSCPERFWPLVNALPRHRGMPAPGQPPQQVPGGAIVQAVLQNPPPPPPPEEDPDEPTTSTFMKSQVVVPEGSGIKTPKTAHKSIMKRVVETTKGYPIQKFDPSLMRDMISTFGEDDAPQDAEEAWTNYCFLANSERYKEQQDAGRCARCLAIGHYERDCILHPDKQSKIEKKYRELPKDTEKEAKDLPCEICGSGGHWESKDCLFKDYKCTMCCKMGHHAVLCQDYGAWMDYIVKVKKEKFARAFPAYNPGGRLTDSQKKDQEAMARGMSISENPDLHLFM